MASIRADFVGITIVRDKKGRDIILRAGDTVPRGVKIGPHILDDAPAAAEQPVTLESTPADHGQGNDGDEDQRDADPESTAEPAGQAAPGADDEDDHEDDETGTDTSSVEDSAAKLAIPPQGGAGSGVDAWRAYALAAVAARGFNIELPDDATRADIIEALVEADIPVE